MKSEKEQLNGYKIQLYLMEDKLCEYVDSYNKALITGEEKQVSLSKAVMATWNALCQSKNLCSPPEYKEHGTEAIHARHELKNHEMQAEIDEALKKEKEKAAELAKQQQSAEVLKKVTEEAGKVCEKDELEKQLKRVEAIFANYTLLRSAIPQTSQLISDVEKKLAVTTGETRQANLQKTLRDEKEKLKAFKLELYVMEDKLCDYVSNYKQALAVGVEKQVLLNRAVIATWNDLCQKKNLCSPPEYKEHGAEAIHARHESLKDDEALQAEIKAHIEKQEKQREHAQRLQSERALEKTVEEAAKACGKDLLDRKLKKVNNVFNNCVTLWISIPKINDEISIATIKYDKLTAKTKHTTTTARDYQERLQKTLHDENTRLENQTAALRSMENILCGYVDGYKKALTSGEKKEVLLNKAVIDTWNVLCQRKNLCSPPKYEEYGAEAIYARHTLKDDKQQEAKSETKEYAERKERAGTREGLFSQLSASPALSNPKAADSVDEKAKIKPS